MYKHPNMQIKHCTNTHNIMFNTYCDIQYNTQMLQSSKKISPNVYEKNIQETDYAEKIQKLLTR